jgi:hypothetical protein
MTTVAASSHIAPSLDKDERAARNGRGIAFASLGFGIYFLVIAVMMLFPHPDANILGVILMAVIGLFFTVTGARGIARTSKNIREFNATRSSGVGPAGGVNAG